MNTRRINPNPTVHNYSTYINHRCRCEVCKAASAAHARQRREAAAVARRRAELDGRSHIVRGIKHGRSGYANYSCRCPVCRSASSSYHTARRNGGGS